MLQNEAIPESLKNMLLVMHTAGVLEPNSNNEECTLARMTWERIGLFMPMLKDYIFSLHNNTGDSGFIGITTSLLKIIIIIFNRIYGLIGKIMDR